MKFTVYERATGRITRTGQCQGATFDMQAGEGETVIEGEYPDDLFYFVDGSAVPIPPRPSGVVTFDHRCGEWADARSIEDAKAEAKAKVVAWASAALAPFTSGYPSEEVVAWGSKLAAARKVLAGAAEPLISIEAQALGVPATALAAKVVEKGSLYEAIVALASAIRGKTHAAIDAAASANEVDAVLASAMDEATATLASLGVRNG